MRKPFESPDFRLGVLGGGQLGKMLVLAAQPWDIHTSVLDPVPDAPCSTVAPEFVVGDFRDFDTVYAFGKTTDVLTIEIEQVNTDALDRLAAEGVVVHPSPAAIRIIQDKGAQKQFYIKHGLPTSPFECFEDADAVRMAVAERRWSVPFVQKSRTMGYDGRGVHVVSRAGDLDHLLDGPCLLEPKIEIALELAVIVAKGPDNDVVAFPPVEMVFDPSANLVDYLVCPASISDETRQQAVGIAKDVLLAFDMQGVLAVELFLTRDGTILVNEVAPRPHNSGHQTIESCFTSQYQQHVRSVLGLPLGSTQLKMPSVMLNLLGAPGFSGPVRYDGIRDVLTTSGVFVHLYGKTQTRPFRKMGHVTILDPDLESALEKATYIKKTLRIVS